MSMLRFGRIANWLVVLALFGLGAGCMPGSSKVAPPEQVVLKYWRVFDNEEDFAGVIADYRRLHPQVQIEYKKLRPEEYETELVRALAEGEGPDLFSVHNASMGEFESLMVPMPTSVQVAFFETIGSLRKENVYTTKEVLMPTTRQIRDNFVDVVEYDAYRVPDGMSGKDGAKIFGLPLFVDTLAMFYNNELLNAAGIAEPPATWEEFQEAVRKLTVINEADVITQSGAALGTTVNVERAPDIIAALMMQNGTEMVDDQGNVAFDQVPEGFPDDAQPAVDAVRFYVNFASSNRDVYTWNNTFPNSFEGFATGKTAIFFGYSYHLPLLRAAAPKLKFTVAKLPQIQESRQVNFANYWLEGVAKSSKHQNYAWDFIRFITSADEAKKFILTAQKPTALTSLINTQLNDEEMGVFAEQTLTAQSWYKGKDPAAMEAALNQLAEATLLGEDPVGRLRRAASLIKQSY